MRAALIGDIHGNLQALEAVLAALERRGGADALLVLGDVVGYGADPGPCLDLVRARANITVLGNHDAAAAGVIEPDLFNPEAREAVLWTRAALDTAGREWLARLPLTGSGDGTEWTLVHSSLREPEEFPYIDTLGAARRCLDLLAGRFCAVGHSHVPLLLVQEEPGGPVRAASFPEGPLRVPPAPARLLVNVGSVGQPRDSDPRACVVVHDGGTGTLELLRVPYDLQEAGWRIIQAGLSPLLAGRLRMGW